MIPRIAFTTYGAHLSTNKFRHCSTGILAGVQQRHKAEIAGSMCGARKSIASPVDFAEVDLVHQAVAASDAQQGIGRLRCRQVVAGKAKPVRIFICHRDSRDQQFKARLLRAFPRATWTDQASENRKKVSEAYKISLKVAECLESHYEGQPVSPTVLREWLFTGRQSIRESHRFMSNKLIQRAVQIFLMDHKDTWTRVVGASSRS